MPVAVTRKLVATCLDFPHKFWKLFRDPSHKEKCSLHVVPVEKFERALRTLHYARGPSRPAAFRYGIGEGFDHEIVLHVHTHNVDGPRARLGSAIDNCLFSRV